MARHADDLTAVQLDALTIHALATRDTDLIDRRDPVVSALAGWVAQIDEGIESAVPFVLPGAYGRAASASGRRGRTGRAALIAGSTVLALAVSGGAAAAMTGDPLAAIRAPMKVLAKVNPFAGDGADKAADSRELLPQQTPAKAQANKLLADARRALAQGHPHQARRLAAEAEALLGDQANPGQQKRIDKLSQDAPGVAGQPGKPDNSGASKGKGPGDKSDNPGASKGKGPGDTPDNSGAPKGKGPGDTPDPGSGGSTGTGASDGGGPDSQAKPDPAKPPKDQTSAGKPTAAPGKPDQSAVETTTSP
jgi:hypothetical protein